jgi:hypothetical protein
MKTRRAINPIAIMRGKGRKLQASSPLSHLLRMRSATQKIKSTTRMKLSVLNHRSIVPPGLAPIGGEFKKNRNHRTARRDRQSPHWLKTKCGTHILKDIQAKEPAIGCAAKRNNRSRMFAPEAREPAAGCAAKRNPRIPSSKRAAPRRRRKKPPPTKAAEFLKPFPSIINPLNKPTSLTTLIS